jgi:outer membrane protein assembly factor BamB
MDKKTEMALRRQSQLRLGQAPEKLPSEVELALPPPTAAAASTPTGWWMYHGDPAHTGYVSDSDLNSTNVGSSTFALLHSLQLGGPVLSVPAVTDGFIYVGLANAQQAEGGNGGALHKIEIETGKIVASYNWNLGNDERDAHSFTGMGSTPAVINGRVYFGAFNGKLYCLDQETLAEIWFTDLRQEDILHNQPITNIAGLEIPGMSPPAVIWTSPVISADGTKLYVGCGEGENPQLFSFVFCLDTATGVVNWIFCTNQFSATQDNQPNVLPQSVLLGTVPPQFTGTSATPVSMGCSVWGAIAYDADLNRIYCSTGNQQPEPNGSWSWPGPPARIPEFQAELPWPGYPNGVLSLDANTGEVQGFFQVPAESNYRPSDIDVDLGGAPVIFELNGQKVIIVACKNGSCFVLDAKTLQLIKRRQMLPYMNDGSRIATVDRHPATGALSPHIPNEISDRVPNENFSGVFNTGAIYPGSNGSGPAVPPTIFYGIGGPNYHSASPGIDYETTPFVRAINLSSEALDDTWPLDSEDPKKYVNGSRTDDTTGQTVGLYASAGESALSSPAVVNDVVFCTTSKVSIYAFKVSDGTLLWDDDLGMQTDGYNGGYGYCLGPAVWKNYVIAGALVFGRDGGILNIYGLTPPPSK